jgi:putative RNase toxin 33 of polymorphic toxin system
MHIPKYDLYKNRDGDILVKPKDGRGPGDPTGLNINDFK